MTSPPESETAVAEPSEAEREYDTCPECQGLREDQITGMRCWRCNGLGEVEYEHYESDDTCGNPDCTECL